MFSPPARPAFWALRIAWHLGFLVAGAAAVALWLGRLLLADRVRPGRGGLVLSFLLGGVVLVVAGLVPVLGGLAASAYVARRITMAVQ